MVSPVSGMNTAGISWATPRENARSVAVWPEGNEEVMGPGSPSPPPGGRLLPTHGLMPNLVTIAAAP